MLYRIVGSQPDRQVRRLLLKCRRDLFKWRPLLEAELNTLRATVADNEWQQLTSFHGLILQYDMAIQGMEAVHTTELAHARGQFRQLAHDSDFQNAVFLASPSLFSQLSHYLADRILRPSKAERVELALLRYFVRMATKATPFGRFCAVIPGSFVPTRGKTALTRPAIRFRGDPSKKVGFPRLNKVLLRSLRAMIEGDALSRKFLQVELNPTATEVNGRLVFVAKADGREVVQKVERDAAVRLIKQTASRFRILSLSKLNEILAADRRVAAAKSEVSLFLDKVIETGLLDFCHGISDGEPDWVDALAKILTTVPSPLATRLLSHLKPVQKALRSYTQAGLNERVDLDRQIRVNLLAALGEEQPSRLPRSVLYEDVTSKARCEVRAASVLPALTALEEYAGLLCRIGWSRIEQAMMRSFFDTFYGNEKAAVSLLTFYEDYYRRHLKDHLEKQHQYETQGGDANNPPADVVNPFGSELVRNILQARVQIRDVIQRHWADAPDAEEIAIDRTELLNALAQVLTPSDPCWSLAVFAQVLPNRMSAGGCRIRIKDGDLVTGYGKYYSRFLHMLPQRFLRDVCRDNAELASGRLAEISGDDDFNANLRPRLCPWEISYPGAHSRSRRSRLDIVQLVVARDRDDEHALCLVDRSTSHRVLPVDLGFLNWRYRPPLYQLLVRFSPVVASSPLLPARYQEGHISDPNTMVRETHSLYRPRITYSGSVILAPKRWSIPRSLLPVQERDESAGRYFLRLNRWRFARGIPDEVFVRVQAKPDDPDLDPKDQQHGLTFAKPQYIAFNSTFLVRLFARLTSNPSHSLVIIEECLPSLSELPCYRGEPYATEFIIQIERGHGARLSTQTGVHS